MFSAILGSAELGLLELGAAPSGAGRPACPYRPSPHGAMGASTRLGRADQTGTLRPRPDQCK